MLLAAASDGNGFGRALLGCVAGIGFLYGLLRVLRIGRRGRGLPPGSCFFVLLRLLGGEAGLGLRKKVGGGATFLV